MNKDKKYIELSGTILTLMIGWGAHLKINGESLLTTDVLQIMIFNGKVQFETANSIYCIYDALTVLEGVKS
jgi:hypothetical protein